MIPRRWRPIARGCAQLLELPAEPSWLNQVHGTEVVDLDARLTGRVSATADASIATLPGRVCVVMVADCLPVLFASRDGQRIAAAHAGWRGLAAGVLERTVAALGVAPAELSAWLGPAISQQHFEVGEEVRAAFVGADAGAAACFSANDARALAGGSRRASRAAASRHWAWRRSAAASGARSLIARSSISHRRGWQRGPHGRADLEGHEHAC